MYGKPNIPATAGLLADSLVVLGEIKGPHAECKYVWYLVVCVNTHGVYFNFIVI